MIRGIDPRVAHREKGLQYLQRLGRAGPDEPISGELADGQIPGAQLRELPDV
jgi:hypothetical protein